MHKIDNKKGQGEMVLLFVLYKHIKFQNKKCIHASPKRLVFDILDISHKKGYNLINRRANTYKNVQ